MKLITTTSAAALITVSSVANAGGLADPVMTMQPEIIVADTAGSSSSAGLIVPLILVALIAVALSKGGGATAPTFIPS